MNDPSKNYSTHSLAAAGISELTEQELVAVAGGITSQEAGRILVVYGTSIAMGALVGAVAAGPGGMIGGAILGAARVATTGGVLGLVSGAYASSGGGRHRGSRTVSG
jgi:hypothetical protein